MRAYLHVYEDTTRLYLVHYLSENKIKNKEIFRSCILNSTYNFFVECVCIEYTLKVFKSSIRYPSQVFYNVCKFSNNNVLISFNVASHIQCSDQISPKISISL